MDRKYAIWQIVKHKWFVFVAGLKFGCGIWQLIMHDLSKFMPRERKHISHPLPYAWNYHANRNPHHCEFWYSRTGGRGCGNFANAQCLPMPKKYVVEMVADWFGASRAYYGFWPPKSGWTWFETSFWELLMHKTTRAWTLEILTRHGYLRDTGYEHIQKTLRS